MDPIQAWLCYDHNSRVHATMPRLHDTRDHGEEGRTHRPRSRSADPLPLGGRSHSSHIAVHDRREHVHSPGVRSLPTRSHSQPSLSQSQRAHTRPPILFYDRNKPYYEFTNFARTPIHWDGRMYPTAEHLFQAHKFMPHRPDLARHIRLLPNSRAALEDSGRLKQYQRLDWFDVNIAVMDIVLEAKFTQYLSLWDLFSVPATTR